MGVTRGLNQARQNSFITVAENSFMALNKDGAPIFRSDVGSDGNGLSNPQNWIVHNPDGRIVDEGAALVGDEGVVGRTFMPQYELMEQIIRHTSGLPVSDTLIDGDTRRKIVWIDPDNAPPAIESITGYYGPDESAARLLGGKLRSWNIDTRRGADGGSAGGSLEYHFNRYERNVVIPGAVASNARVRFIKNGATQSGVFRVSVYTGAAGAGETKRITATNATGDGSFLLPDTPQGAGGTIVITPGMSAGDLQTAIRALPGYPGAVVTGSTVAGTADLAEGATATGTLPNPSYLVDNNLTTFPTIGSTTSGVIVDIGATPDETEIVRIYCGVVGGLGLSLLVETSEIGDFTDAVTQVNVPNSSLTSNAWNAFPITPIAAQFWRVRLGAPPGASANWIAELELLGAGGLASGSYDVSFASGLLSTVDVPDWPSSGGNGWTSITVSPFSLGGWSSSLVTIAPSAIATAIATAFEAATGVNTVSVTKRGGTGSYVPGNDDEFEIVFTDPGQTRVRVEKVSGNLWTAFQISLGSAGNELTYFNGPYLEPDHWRVYLAKTDSELADIDMEALPDEEGNGGDIHLLENCVGMNYAWSDLVKPHYTGNKKRFATDFVAGARTLAVAVILPSDDSEGSDTDYMIRTQEGCSSTGFWLRRAWGCGGYELWEDIFVGRREAIGFEVDNDVWMRTFPLGRRRNPVGISMRWTLILPV